MVKNIFRNIAGFIKENVWTIVPVMGAIGGMILVFGMPFFTCGGDTLSENSKTAECAEDLQGALSAFSKEMDMQYPIGPDDYKTIFDTGEIQKEYLRDGIRYTAYFNLNKTDSGCYLKFYKRGKLEPGHFSTSLGNYGSVILKKCRCDGEKSSTVEPNKGEKAYTKAEPKEGKNYIWIDLGIKDRGKCMTHAPVFKDGITEADVKAGVDCKKLPYPYSGPGHNHMYFNIDDSFMRGGKNLRPM